jgi:hypothetical protein
MLSGNGFFAFSNVSNASMRKMVKTTIKYHFTNRRLCFFIYTFLSFLRYLDVLHYLITFISSWQHTENAWLPKSTVAAFDKSPSAPPSCRTSPGRLAMAPLVTIQKVRFIYWDALRVEEGRGSGDFDAVVAGRVPLSLFNRCPPLVPSKSSKSEAIKSTNYLCCYPR